MVPKGGKNMVGGSKFLKDRNYCGASLCMDVLIWLSFFITQWAKEGHKYVIWLT